MLKGWGLDALATAQRRRRGRCGACELAAGELAAGELSRVVEMAACITC